MRTHSRMSRFIEELFEIQACPGFTKVIRTDQAFVDIPLLSEVFLHWNISRQGKLLFSTRYEEGGRGDVHFTLGRRSSSLPQLVQAMAAQLGEDLEMVVECTKDSFPFLCEEGVDGPLQVSVQVQRVYPFYSVTPDNLVRRRILQEGSGRDSPELGGSVTVSLALYLGTEPESWSSEETTITFTVSHGEVGQGLEEAVCKMKVGELSLIEMPRDYMYGSLYMQEMTNLPSEGLSETLFFTISLLSFENIQAIWEMDQQTRNSFAALKRKQGNNYFKEGLWERALSVYEQVLDLLPAEGEDRVACLNNLGLCSFKLGKLGDVKDYCGQVLELEPCNTKARTIRASAYNQCGAPELALEDVGEVMRLQQRPSSLLKALEKQARKQIGDAEKREQNMFGGKLIGTSLE